MIWVQSTHDNVIAFHICQIMVRRPKGMCNYLEPWILVFNRLILFKLADFCQFHGKKLFSMIQRTEIEQFQAWWNLTALLSSWLASLSIFPVLFSSWVMMRSQYQEVTVIIIRSTFTIWLLLFIVLIFMEK